MFAFTLVTCEALVVATSMLLGADLLPAAASGLFIAGLNAVFAGIAQSRWAAEQEQKQPGPFG